ADRNDQRPDELTAAGRGSVVEQPGRVRLGCRDRTHRSRSSALSSPGSATSPPASPNLTTPRDERGSSRAAATASLGNLTRNTQACASAADPRRAPLHGRILRPW